MSWSWSVGPWNTGPALDLARATARSVTWKWRDSASASFTVPHYAPAFGSVFPLQTDLWIYRDGQVEFRGRIGGHTASDNTADKASRTHTAGDYREVLNRRALLGPNFGWTSGTDPADAAWQVIVDEQARPGSNLGITRGTTIRSGTVSTPFGVDVSKPVKEALDTIAGVAAGGVADWDITPVGDTGLHFDWWTPTRGTDRGVVIDVGGVAVSASDTADTTGYANGLRTSGQAPSGGGTAPAPYRLDVADMTSRPEGRWDLVETTDQTTETALQQWTANRLPVVQVTPISWTAKLRRGWWQGRDHFFPGDPFEFSYRLPAYDPDTGQLLHMAYDVDETMVLQELTATFDGVEVYDEATSMSREEPSVSITFGAPARNERFWQRSVDSRLRALERR